jgi:hypothetical protein
VLYSAVLPGSGQIYAGNTVRGVLLGIGALGGLGATLYLNQQYSENNDQYYQDKEAYENNTDRDKMEQLYNAITTSYDQMESSYNSMRIAAGVTVVVWLYNIIDAYLFFPDQSGYRISAVSTNNYQGLAISLNF